MTDDRNLKERTEDEQLNAQEVISKGEKFVEKNINIILYAVLGIVVIGFGIWGYIKYIKHPREEKASTQLFMAEERFMAGEDSLALVASSIGGDGLLDVAAMKGTKAANLAHAYAGICYYDMAQYEKALEELKKFDADENMVAPSITRLIGDCLVQLKKYDDAVGYFEKAAKQADNDVVSPSCWIKAGRVYEELKKYDQALKAYQMVKDKYYTAPEAEAVEADIIRVKSNM